MRTLRNLLEWATSIPAEWNLLRPAAKFCILLLPGVAAVSGMAHAGLKSHTRMRNNHNNHGATVKAYTVKQSPSALSRTDEKWEGLSGSELMEAIAADCRPVALASINADDENSVFSAWSEAEKSDNGGLINHFSNEPLTDSGSTGLKSTTTRLTVASPEWWSADHPYRDSLKRDLYNCFPASMSEVKRRGNLYPGTVTNAESDNGIWTTGTGFLDERPFPFWEPPEEIKGDVARAMFYMTTLYSIGLPERKSANNLIYWKWASPLRFSIGASAQLMEWHRSDPVSEYEKTKNDVYSKIQGNRNPFVDFPEIAEYLWSASAGKPYHSNETPPSPPSGPLRPSYKISDREINLYSPHIPSDAVWSVDNVPVNGKSLSPGSIGLGNHVFEFTSSTMNGTVIITILPE